MRLVLWIADRLRRRPGIWWAVRRQLVLWVRILDNLQPEDYNHPYKGGGT